MELFNFYKSILPILIFTAGLTSLAADRFSVKNWQENLSTTLKTKNVAAMSKAIETDDLQKSIIKNCSDCKNKELMKTARDLFAKGNYEEARAVYNNINKKSDYWLESIEEKGWTYFRQNQFDAVLAQTKTLLSSPFNEYVRSEAYLLQSLSHLKVCDYKNLFLTNSLFKEKMKRRLLAIQKLSESGMNDSFLQFISKDSHFPLKLEDIGSLANDLPYLFFKDTELQEELFKYKTSQAALIVLSQSSDVQLRTLQKKLETKKLIAAKNLKIRMQKLATQETEENFKIVQKLNLVEVEGIQRLHFDMDLDQKLFNKEKFKETTVDQMVFVDDGRPWIDELDKYEVRSKYCPQNIRRKM